MPKVSGSVLANKVDEKGNFLVKIQLNRKMPRVGENVTVKWGSTRSLAQNSFLWVFYSWLINDAGLRDIGHFCPQALHENLKSHFGVKSTATMNKVEMGEWMEKVNLLMIEFFHIDTSPFFQEYKDTYEA